VNAFGSGFVRVVSEEGWLDSEDMRVVPPAVVDVAVLVFVFIV